MMTADVPRPAPFSRMFGGKDVIPLWRNSAADEPNITGGSTECRMPGAGPARLA